MQSKIKLAKIYKYSPLFLNGNTQINNYEQQLNKLKLIKLNILEQWKILLEKEEGNTDALIVLQDINMYLYEYKKAINEVQRQMYFLKKGQGGEEKVSELLYDFRDEWLYLNNIRLEYNGSKIENDHIIIDESGIYTLEVKNIGNRKEKLIFDEYGRVKRLDRRGKVIDQSDIVGQSARHMAYLNKYIKERVNFNVPVYHMVVISSDIAVKNKSDLVIVGPNTIYPYIKSQNKYLSEEQIKYLYNVISDNNIDLAAYPTTQYSEVLEKNYILILESIQELKNKRKKI